MKYLGKVYLSLVFVIFNFLIFNPFCIRSQTVLKVPAYPYETCIADYDQDGDNDIIVGCSGPNQDPDSVVIFFNDGWGNFESTKFQIANQIELNCKDLTGDNFPDIITQTTVKMVFYENDKNDGIGNDYLIMNIDCSPKIGGIADINMDNINDVVYYCRFIPYSWGVQFNNGDHTFTDSAFIVNSETIIQPTIGHLNNDDQPDFLVTTITPDDSIYILYNNYPHFSQNNITSAVWRPGFILNLNNDLVNDITLFQPLYFGPATIENYINNESFDLCNSMQFVNGSRIQNTSDYNLDGFDDITISVYQANNEPIDDSIYIYYNDQDCGFSHVQSIYMGEYARLPTVKHGDLNSDGYPDLVIQGYHFPRDNIRILWNDGTGHFVDTNTVYVYQNEHEITKQINIYPNPASSRLNIEILDGYYFQNILIEIMTIEGRTILSSKNKSNSIQIDIGKLDSGLYLLKLQTDKTLITKKILKL